MSNSTDNLFDLDLQFLPAWAQQPAAKNLYADFEGGEGRREGRGGGYQGERRDRPRGPREGGERRDRPSGPGGPAPAGQPWRGPERSRRDGPPQGRRDGPGGGRRDDRPRERRPEAPRQEAPPLPVNVRFLPDEKGVESLARQIKMTGRAYPLFQIAHMVLERPERHNVEFSIRKDGTGAALQPLFVCVLDESLWISEDEAVRYTLDRHFGTFYQAEKTPVDPPKGTYTFVAQCGLSGEILGPPNHHDYGNRLRKLHTERFSRMPFEVFKTRVRIVRDEAVVKKWLEDQSWKVEFVCLNMPEPLRLGTREEVEQHFRTTHQPNMIRSVETHKMTGKAARSLRCAALQRVVRQAWEEQRRFPLQTSTILSQQFGSHGLQFFKINKNQTHVAVARPHFLDLETNIVSDGVKRMIAFVNDHPKCTRRNLIEALVPGAVQYMAAANVPVPVAPAGTDPAAVIPAVEPATPPPELTAAIADLHWLIHQGHVIEFADGTMETAKKPKPRPVAAPAPVETVPSEASLAAEGSPVAVSGEETASGVSASAETAPVEQTLAPVQIPEPAVAIAPVASAPPTAPVSEEKPAEPSA